MKKPRRILIATLFVLIGVFFSYPLQAQDLNDLVLKLNQTKDNKEKITLLKEVGAYYQKKRAYQKAIDYFSQTLELQKSEGINGSREIQLRQSIAYCYAQQKGYFQAISEYEAILSYQRQNENKQEQVNTLTELSSLYKIILDNAKAINYTQEILQIHQEANNQAGMANAYNNLGFLYKEAGDNAKSLEHYQKALNLNLQNKQNQKNLSEKATLFTNTGVTYSYLRDFKTANQYFSNALDIYQAEGNLSQQAHANNYLAANHYISSKNDLAISTALKAVDIAKTANDQEALLESYQILAEAYQQDGDFKEAQKYSKLIQELKDKIAEKERLAQQQILEEQINVEKKENELNQLLADREKQELALKQSELERQKQEQDLKLRENEVLILKRNQELQASAIRNQQLERDRIAQLLENTQQKALSDAQKQEIEKQKLLAEKQRIEKEQAETEKKQTQEAAQKEKEIRAKEAQQEKVLRNYGYGIIGLVLVVAIVLFMSFINIRKTARQLQVQNKIIEEKGMEIEQQNSEILAQNEELFQNQEEIMAQKEYIEKKNKNLEAHSQQISRSIRAANTIQRAILPHREKLDELLKNYFIIYRPKDIVSGDFYWLNKDGDTTTFVAADCTGHGVPGAFMTLIGNTLLDKIIRVWRITSPEKILARLNDEVRVVLRQEETKNFIDGMDMSIISMKSIENEQVHISFAGAKNNLYYCSAEDSQIQTVRGSRKSIGGSQNSKIFYENNEIILPLGSTIYLGSDGLQDQNNMMRTRFSERKLISVLQENCLLPLSVQQENIEKILDNYMAGTDQRDDILWVGIKI
ncbi:MAG: hypothetical protein EAZ08_06545 [Cytophagales bacterium]|nr:MAG: hypothetical protein EAZ08_06545 [Cytophagales bacterium]